jgi:putative photosynthetic complex assembly protein 2
MSFSETVNRFVLYAGLPLFAVVVWWAATVAIIFACGRRAWRKPVFIGYSIFAAAVCATIPFVSRDASLRGALLAFLVGIVAWGWFEVSYYTGYVVGRDVPPCPPDCGGWKHFVHGVNANLHHELSIIAGFAVVYALHGVGANRVALWTFTIHWWMHQSAKLNVFFGVRNLNEEYLPEHLRRMAQFFTKRPINFFFPFSVTISTACAHWLFFQARAATDRVEMTSNALLCTLMALAILEHWWLILPQPVGLWAWGLLSRRKTSVKPTVDIVCGFLGSGKTTLITNLAPQLGEKTVVLVNEMGDIGLDGQRLRDEAGGAAGVVELAEGCMCCTLSRNVAASIASVIAEYQPERLIIEPSGVATISDLLGTLHQPGCREMLGVIRVVALVDGVQWTHGEGNRTLRGLIEAQIRAAATVIVNKCDLLNHLQLDTLKRRITVLNPTARLICTSFGRIQLADLSDTNEDACLGDELERRPSFESFSGAYAHQFDAAALREFFHSLEAGDYGDLARAKGVFETEGGWLRLEYADRSVRVEPCAPVPTSSVTVIGGRLAMERLQKALQSCAAMNSAALAALDA